jgi:phosphohistidine phosphatase SixA
MYLYLIRHAQPDYNAPTPYFQPPGPSLTETGLEQAAALAPMLQHSGIERIVSSPLRRCTMTAEPLAAALNLDVLIDDDLRDVKPGDPQPEVTLRMLRAALAQSDKRVVALISHAAPLTWLLQALTHDEVVLPAKDRRGNHLAECMVWGVFNRQGRWTARHLPPNGTAC